MAKSHELRQGTSWTKSKYGVGDGKKLITSKSELRGDATPKNMGHHGTAKGRKNPAEKIPTPKILDRNPAKTTKPWADAPAEPTTTHGHPHWTKAVDAGASPPGNLANGAHATEADIVTLSGDHQWTPANEKVHKSWKKKGYDMDTPGTLPDGELKKKWTK